MAERLSLYVPKLEELWYSRQLLADPATMDYNKGYQLPFTGYDAATGCLEFPESEWADWHANWVGQQPKRFYAYLQRQDGTWVGNVNFHQAPERPWCDMGIVIEGTYRGKGYGKQAMELLLHHAFEVCRVSALHNDFETTRGVAYHLHIASGFREYRRKDGLIELLLTRAEYMGC